MRLTFSVKLLIIFLIVILSYLYALWEKQKFYQHDENYSNTLILKELPTISLTTLDSKKIVVNMNTATQYAGIFVHIWGTWCGPCEKEMPEFLTFAEKNKSRGLKFYLIAVKDDIVKIKKFIKRFPTIPTNVTIAIDHDNQVMDLFGTLKLPETFLFNRVGKHVNKFVGPQEWLQESYFSRLDVWLNLKN
jgi:thiol-disulfide isomerase/thioredoxin